MEIREPLSRGTKALLAAVLVVPAGILAVRADDAADREVAIPRASAAGGDRITVSSVCLPVQRLDIDVREDPRTVTVTVTALDYDPDNREDCETLNEVLLASPLGGRRLVDGATGDEVPVEGREQAPTSQ